MAQSFFGIHFGKQKQTKPSGKKDVVTTSQTFINIPPAEDILNFHYPPESRFYDNMPDKAYSDH